MKVKEQSAKITAAREAPFSFWEREKQRQKMLRSASEDQGLNVECTRAPFKANPIPKACSVLIFE